MIRRYKTPEVKQILASVIQPDVLIGLVSEYLDDYDVPRKIYIDVDGLVTVCEFVGDASNIIYHGYGYHLSYTFDINPGYHIIETKFRHENVYYWHSASHNDIIPSSGWLYCRASMDVDADGYYWKPSGLRISFTRDVY